MDCVCFFLFFFHGATSFSVRSWAAATRCFIRVRVRGETKGGLAGRVPIRQSWDVDASRRRSAASLFAEAWDVSSNGSSIAKKKSSRVVVMLGAKWIEKTGIKGQCPETSVDCGKRLPGFTQSRVNVETTTDRRMLGLIKALSSLNLSRLTRYLAVCCFLYAPCIASRNKRIVCALRCANKQFVCAFLALRQQRKLLCNNR